MLPTPEHSTADASQASALVTGDLGVVVVRALLENGVGTIISSWRDRPTPIDAAVDDARERVLSPRGIVLRRLRTLASLEPLLRAPIGGITKAPARTAVVFSGRNGLRPALEQFVRVECAGGVVGFCFDADAVRIEDALVIEPEPTAIGLVRAIDAAFRASVLAGRPALVVLRERTLGMRGTIRRRPDRAPADAADADAVLRANGEAGAVPVLDAALATGLASVLEPAESVVGAPTSTLVVSGALRHAAERALAVVSARLRPVAAERIADRVRIVALATPGLVPPVEAADGVLVLGTRAARIAERLVAAGMSAELVTEATVDADCVRGEQLVARLAAWLASTAPNVSDVAAEVLEALAAGGIDHSVDVDASRIPRRSEVVHRAVPPTVAAGLVLAQGVVGVPARLDAAYPSYRTDTGVVVTVVTAATFAEHGAACAAPGSGAGVFVVTGTHSGVVEAAGGAGASVEYVDGSSPRAIGAAIARACAGPRAASHVLVVSEVQRVAAGRRGSFGLDPELVGTDRLATAAVPTSATVVVDLGSELHTGPSTLVLDHPDAHGALEPLRTLSPASWDLVRTGGKGRAARLAWNLRRRLVRAAAGVDL